MEESMDDLKAVVEAAGFEELLRRLIDAGVQSLDSRPPTLEELFLRHYDTVMPGSPQVAP